MLVIRFNRVGKKNRAQFKIVVQERAVAPGGRHVEIVGSYDPHSKKTVLKKERVSYWLEKGAQASDSVHNLLLKEGVTQGEKRKMKIPAKKVEATETEPAPAEKKEEPVSEEKKPAEAPKVEKPAEAKPEEKKEAPAPAVIEETKKEEEAKPEEAKNE